MYRSLTNAFRIIIAPGLFLSFICLPLYAQTATATLSGTIQDQNGAVIPGVAVTIVNEATSFERTATTNESGSFTITLLPPGTYSITARRDGFTTVKVPDLILNVGDQKAMRIDLKVGDVNAAIEVRPDETLVSTSPAVATTIDRTFVGNLPLNGRSFQSLILLTPGVTIATSNASADFGQFSVNGQRASTNYFTVDGVSANIGIGTSTGGAQNLALAGAYPGLSAFGTTTGLVSVDALEEFKIQTSSYSAELGRQPGGQVSLVTRSGTNQFRGSAFEYLRNEAFDARAYFNQKPLPESALRQNQFGGTFSGPLPFFNFGEGGPFFNRGKDRTFFFFSYEDQRLRLPRSSVSSVPSLRVRDLAAPAVRMLLDAFPLPTGPELLNTNGTPTGRSPYNLSVSSPSSLDATSIRIDHVASKNLAFFGRFNESPSYVSTQGFVVTTTTSAATRTLTLGSTWLPTHQISNDLRFNYSRQENQSRRNLEPRDGGIPFDPSLLTNGYPGLGAVSFGTLGGITIGVFGDFVQRQLNLVDHLSITKGSHQLKFGIDYRRLAPIYGTLDQQNITFSSVARIQSGIAGSLSIFTFQPSRPRFDNFSAFAQDAWKIRPNLTVDLGLRWELNPPPTEADGKIPPLAVGIVGTDVSMATLAPVGTPFYKTIWNAFAPRFGVAYLLNQKPGRETVIRGGFGVYYDLGNGAATNSYPLTANSFQSNVPFPVSAAQATRPSIVLPNSLPTSLQVTSLDQNLRLPYTLQWNLAVEQSLGSQQTLSVSYVGSAGRRLLATQFLNQPAGFVGPRPNPNFADIVYSFNGPTSDYKSLQAQYRARLKSGLQALVNYTWSHAIDEASSDIEPFVFERGNATFDVRHNLSAAVNYDLPTPPWGKFLKYLFSKWSIDGILHAQSGTPVDLASQAAFFVRPDGTLITGRPDVIPGVPFYIKDPAVAGGRRFNSAAFTPPPPNPDIPFFPARQGTLGRNALRALPIYQIDLAIGRTFPLTESLKLKLKAEAFNALNHPMFSNYDTDFLSSNFGVPNQTLGTGLGGLNSLYQLGGPRSIQLSLRLTF